MNFSITIICQKLNFNNNFNITVCKYDSKQFKIINDYAIFVAAIITAKKANYCFKLQLIGTMAFTFLSLTPILAYFLAINEDFTVIIDLMISLPTFNCITVESFIHCQEPIPMIMKKKKKPIRNGTTCQVEQLFFSLARRPKLSELKLIMQRRRLFTLRQF